MRRAIVREDEPENAVVKEMELEVDILQDVIGAIRKAPKEDKGRRKHKH